MRQALEGFASEGTSTPRHRPTEDVDVELTDFGIEGVSPRVDRVAWIELAGRRPSVAMALTVLAAIGISMSSLLMRDALRKHDPRGDRSAKRNGAAPSDAGTNGGGSSPPVAPAPHRFSERGARIDADLCGARNRHCAVNREPGGCAERRVLPREPRPPAVARAVQTSLPGERSGQRVVRASGGTPVPIVTPAQIAAAPLGSWTMSASVRIEPEPSPIVKTPDVPSLAIAAAPVAPRNSTSETGAIQVVLGRYRTAFSNLDAGAATAVWPTVDAKALQRAFERLERQNLTFDTCQIAVKEARAVASCGGTARYVSRVGNRSRHDERLKWEFNLRKVDDAWLIDTVSAR